MDLRTANGRRRTLYGGLGMERLIADGTTITGRDAIARRAAADMDARWALDGDAGDGYGADGGRTLHEALGGRSRRGEGGGDLYADGSGIIDQHMGHQTRWSRSGDYWTFVCENGGATRTVGNGWRCACGEWRIAWDGIIWTFRSADDIERERAAAKALLADAGRESQARALKGWARIDFLNGADSRRRGLGRTPGNGVRRAGAWRDGWDWQDARTPADGAAG